MSIEVFDNYFKEGRKIVTVKDVEPEQFIKAFSQHLKRQGRFELPKWADVVKTSKAKELPPSDPDWLYVRTASMVRKIYIRKGMGVGAFKKVYGGQKRRGTCTNVFTKSSGKIARYILQQLEDMGLVEHDEQGGRMITKDDCGESVLLGLPLGQRQQPKRRRKTEPRLTVVDKRVREARHVSLGSYSTAIVTDRDHYPSQTTPADARSGKFELRRLPCSAAMTQGGAATLLTRPPPQNPAQCRVAVPPRPPAQGGAAALLTRPPPQGGAASLLTRPPPQGGAAALLTRPPPQESLPTQPAPSEDASPSQEAQPPSASASVQDWEDDYDLPVQKDLGDGWDGYGELEEFETLASEPPAQEAPAEAATTAPAKLEEAKEAAAPAAPKEEPRKQPKHIFIASQPGVGKTTLVHKLLEKLREEDGEGGVDVRGFYTEEVRDPANPKQRLGFDVVRVGCLEPDEQTRSVLAREGKAPPTVGKYSVDVAAFEAFALPALEPPKEEEFQLPENPRLFKLSDGTEKVVSLLYEPTDEEEGANSRIRLEFGEVLNVPPSSLREVPEGWKPEDEEEEEEPVPRLCVVDEVGKMGLLSVQFPKTLARVLEQDTVLATGVQTAKGQRDPEPVEEIKKSPGARVVKLTRGNRDAVVEQTYAFLRESLGLGPAGTGKPKPRREEERRAKEQAEREAREREEKEREEAAEKDKAARKERQLAKEKARAERLAKEKAEREVEAAKARAERKKRAEARQKAVEDAKNGLVPCVEHDDEEDVEAVAPSLDLVEDIDVVEEKAAPPRKRRKGQPSPVSSAGSSPPELPASPEGSPSPTEPVDGLKVGQARDRWQNMLPEPKPAQSLPLRGL
eukprot:s5202_g2.t1